MTMISTSNSISTLARASTVPDNQPRLLSEIALSGIYEVSKILAKPARLETTLSNVLNVLSSYLDMRHSTIMLLDGDDVPDMVVGTCWKQSLASDASVRLPRKALDRIIATAMPLVVENTANDALFDDISADPPDPIGEPSSFIGVPIKIEDRVVGTLSIDRARSRLGMVAFDHDVRFLSMIANLIGQTIHLHRVIARDRERLMEQSRRLEKELTISRPEMTAPVQGIIGDSAPIRALLDKIQVVAKSNATILLRGESGTGKELFARAIHELSPRAKGPFIKVNCAALPETVLESELFGHEKGAFTGAINSRKGRFEMADGGTLFLDEIGEISASFQAKLLRVLQEGEFDRVGSTRTQKVNVRIVAATNRDLEADVARGSFRADLYYRISVVPLRLPSLRDRKGDIPALAEAFLKRFNKENGRDLKLTTSALRVLTECYFPGNVRELENCICRTATLTNGPAIKSENFACEQGDCLSATLWQSKAKPSIAAGPQGISLPRHVDPMPVTLPPASLKEPAEHAETVKPCRCGRQSDDDACGSPDVCNPLGIRVSREQLVEAMERSGWVQAKAARILGLTPRQIGYALKKHNVEMKKF